MSLIARSLRRLADWIDPPAADDQGTSVCLDPQVIDELDMPHPAPSVVSLPEYGNGGSGDDGPGQEPYGVYL